MKKENKPNSDYATNKGGRIVSPKGTPKDEPKVTKTVGGDLRGGKK